MARIGSFIAALVFFAASSTASADWRGYGTGTWPQTWPKSLEPLRKQSSSIRGGVIDLVIHHIPFTNREQFEAAWPQLLKVKTKGAPVILVRSPGTHWHFGETKAGVLVHCPPGGVEPEESARPIPSFDGVRERWMNTTYIELIVDGEIIDLNHIPLPPDTPIIDERFPKRAVQGGEQDQR